MRNYLQYTILKSVIGSQAYNMALPGSDLDIRGVFLPPTKWFWGLESVPESVDGEGEDETYFELGKFVKLAMAANPTILEVLYSPTILRQTFIGSRLLSIREYFLSQAAYNTYRGYAKSQMEKMNSRDHVNWKNAAHMLRLMIVGTRLMESGTVNLDMGEVRQDLLAVKRGEWSLHQVMSWYRLLEADFDSTARVTVLPDKPDWEVINAFLVQAREIAAHPSY